jgi:hypothetical protein
MKPRHRSARRAPRLATIRRRLTRLRPTSIEAMSTGEIVVLLHSRDDAPTVAAAVRELALRETERQLGLSSRFTHIWRAMCSGTLKPPELVLLIANDAWLNAEMMRVADQIGDVFATAFRSFAECWRDAQRRQGQREAWLLRPVLDGALHPPPSDPRDIEAQRRAELALVTRYRARTRRAPGRPAAATVH